MKKCQSIIPLGLLLLIFIQGCNIHKTEKLKSFNLSEVILLDGPFKQAQQTDLKYILALDADRLLAPYLKEAGIKPIKENYPNWENSGLDGHIGGHYLSALSLMYASTGNIELLQRANYMVNWLDTCQIKNGNGYVGGIPNGKALWDDIAQGKVNSGSFSLSDRWVPLYNLHKLYAGLRDVYWYTGNQKALKILINLTDWCIDLTKNLSDEQIQEMLKSEHGGMNEVFADVAEITGDDKYMDLAKRFSQKSLLEPLLNHKNELTGLHANTQIPKVVGYKKIADLTNNKAWSNAAELFWNLVINNWTVSIGGNSVREHFHPANDYSSMVESNQGPETCNTYNMLRLTKLLFLSDPKNIYIDYYERALYNHILSSQNPSRGGFVYFTPMRPRHYRVYSQPQLGFWCCVGTGLENHGKYGELIYAHTQNELLVNLFIASELKWEDKELQLRQITKFPYEEKTELSLQLKHDKSFTLKIRKPMWVTNEGFSIKVNDEIISKKSDSNGYVSILRKWKSGDKIVVDLPMSTHIEYLPDSSNWASILHGPIVLAAISDSNNLDGLWADDSRMGHVASGPLRPISEGPILVTNTKNFADKIIPTGDLAMNFCFKNIIEEEQYQNLKLIPFFEVHQARYIIYWPVSVGDDLSTAKLKLKADENLKLSQSKKTIDQIFPGEQQPESDHNIKVSESTTGITANRHFRQAKGWFSYELPDKNKQAKNLRITYWGEDTACTFDIFINEILLSRVELKPQNIPEFYNIDYKLPSHILSKTVDGKLKIKFVAGKGSKVGGVYYVGLMK